jgi:hypothetical protein
MKTTLSMPSTLLNYMEAESYGVRSILKLFLETVCGWFS